MVHFKLGGVMIPEPMRFQYIFSLLLKWGIVGLVSAFWIYPLATTSADEAKKKSVPKVAHIRISGAVTDSNVSPESPKADGNLLTIRDRISKAANDSTVNVLFLELEGIESGFGTMDELQEAVDSFRKTGKKIVAFTGSGDSKDILLGVSADEFWMPESCWMMLLGVRSEVYFYKEIFDLLGVKADFLKVGDFKSAVEPYTRTSLSEPAKRQMSEMLDDFFNQSMIQRIVAARSSKKLKSEDVKLAIDKAPMTAKAAVAAGILDRVGYLPEAKERARFLAGNDAEIVADFGKTKAEEVDFSNPFSLLKALSPPKPKVGKNPRIALIYAVGEIDTGKSGAGLGSAKVGSDTLVEAIRQAEEDPTVKAIVLRIDSPGGSALASDLIWAELKRSKKPVVASMGDVAASGGYYIAMAAKRIFAEPSTITGSIGVFGGKLAYGPVLKRVGLHSEVISRGANAGVMSGSNPFSESERTAMTALIEDTYTQFLAKGLAGRKDAGKTDYTLEKLASLAGGRVWTGRQAVVNGLVDELGSLEKALAWARDQTDLPKDKRPEVLKLPKPRNMLEDLLDFDLGIQMDAQTKNSFETLLRGLPSELQKLALPALRLARMKGGPVYLLPIEPLNIR